MGNKMLAQAIFHAPCAFGPNGATAEVCRLMTASAARNLNGCTRINCRSPLRICRACVTQGARELVTYFETGLCDFHEKCGADKVPSTQRREKPLPGDEEIDSALPAVARRAEAVAGDSNVVRLELCAPATRPYAPAREASKSVPLEKRQANLPPSPRRASSKRGLMTIMNPDTGATELTGALEVMGMLRKLHDEKRKPWEKAGYLLGITQNTVTVLRALERLPEHIRERLSSSKPPEDRLAVTFAYELTYLAPSKRDAAVAAYLAGRDP